MGPILLILIFTLFQSTVVKADGTILGTWSSKSNTVFTGPGFYDPVDELLIEPDLPGISYSFTEDGYWEEALYVVTANPRRPQCPTAVLIFQHGTYQYLSNGSLVLIPFESDGRQLLSDPCGQGIESVYSRYSQQELMSSFMVSIDKYHGRWKLNLYEWDGNPKQPMYLAYRPPMMLPTEALNPTSQAQLDKANKQIASKGSFGVTGGDAATNGETTAVRKRDGLRERVRRSLENRNRTNARKTEQSVDYIWWGGIGMVIIGAVAIQVNTS